MTDLNTILESIKHSRADVEAGAEPLVPEEFTSKRGLPKPISGDLNQNWMLGVAPIQIKGE